VWRIQPVKEVLRDLRSGFLLRQRRQQPGTKFSLSGKKTSVTKGTDDWDGNFLNWLTTRRIDVMKKVLTGGDGTATPACGTVTEKYKKFSDDKTYTPFNATNQVASLSIEANCNGNARSVMV